MLCHMYAQLGTDLLPKLKGDFAFVLYNAKLVRSRGLPVQTLRRQGRVPALPCAGYWLCSQIWCNCMSA